MWIEEERNPVNNLTLHVDGHLCAMESATLYTALPVLLDAQRRVLLLRFWLELTDKKNI
ncbi:MAG: hypothetical protein U0M15_10025 [Bacillota bacterium]|nr:hypothetical protein [Bacillota bacterium]